MFSWVLCVGKICMTWLFLLSLSLGSCVVTQFSLICYKFFWSGLNEGERKEYMNDSHDFSVSVRQCLFLLHPQTTYRKFCCIINSTTYWLKSSIQQVRNNVVQDLYEINSIHEYTSIDCHVPSYFKEIFYTNLSYIEDLNPHPSKHKSYRDFDYW